MKPAAALILTPRLHLDKLLPITRELLGRNLAQSADTTPIPLKSIIHQLACLAAFRNAKAAPVLSKDCVSLLSVGFVVAAEEEDMILIVEAAKGLDFIVTETQQRGVLAAIVSGTLNNWRTAIACGVKAGGNVQHCYALIRSQLEHEGLGDLCREK